MRMKISNYNKLILIVLLIYGNSSLAFTQSESSNWLFGYPEYQHPLYGTAIINIDSNYRESFKFGGSQVPIEATVSALSTQNKELILFTNGCEVMNKFGGVIENGDELNPGSMHQTMCNKYGYPVPAGAMLIPFPNHANQYILLHLGAEEDNLQSIKYGPLYYSTILFDTLTGEQKVLSKNKVILEGNLEGFDITRHANGRDWWLVATVFPEQQYFIYLISPTGINGLSTLKTGSSFSSWCGKGIGAIKFSPDGKYLARWNTGCGLKLLSFDRCTGTFEMQKEINMAGSGDFGGGGVSFTKNNKYLYVNSQLVIYRIDMNLLPNVKLDSILFADKKWGVSLERSELANDGNIYFSQMAASPIMPFLYNTEDPIAQNVKLDYKNFNLVSINSRSLPHYPNFSLSKIINSGCDTLTQTINVYENKIKLEPNPASNYVILTLPSDISIKKDLVLNFYNEIGVLVLSEDIQKSTTKINISNLPQGIYFWLVNIGHQKLIVAKFVKIP